MTNERGNHVILSAGCRSLQFVPALTVTFGNNKSLSGSTRNGPFKELVICVTGLSKEARWQVQDATERMGGQYSPDLHPQCTHLVVQSFVGRKFEHALKHGIKRGLYVVTLAWFINSAKLNERLDESLYAVSKTMLGAGYSPDSKIFDTSGEQICLPSRIEESRDLSMRSQVQSPTVDHKKVEVMLFKGFNFYIDPCLPKDMQGKVVAAARKEGATFSDKSYVGCNVTHVICERDSFLTYSASTCNLVTPLWLLKSLKEQSLQRLVQLSADLARHLAFIVDSSKNRSSSQNEESRLSFNNVQSEREELVKAAKEGVRRRRGQRKQPCRTLPRPITPATLLENVCWSVTDPPSAAQLYVDKSPQSLHESDFFDAYENGNTSGSECEVFTRPLRESERQDVVYSGAFVTILFPVDRFAEMGLSSRSFFSERGFTRQKIIEHIYAFYQEWLTEEEILVAINTDSKHADKLRALYVTKDNMKRSEFIGGRRCFEGLKRVGRENTGQIYELCLGS